MRDASVEASGILPLVLEDLRFVAAGRVLLDDISATIGAGARTVILGPNGAGKSLLMRLCHGLITPTGGAVRWLGRAAGQTVRELRRRQAMVFQRPVLLRRSALGNVTHALALAGVARRHRRDQAERALHRFGLADLAQRPARVLSGGEQQRLALARAWAVGPEVLFLDEPTAALDPAATRSVEEAIAAFHAAGVKLILSTHDLGQARRLADEVMFLYRGRLLEQTPADVFFREPRSPEARAFLRGDLLWW